MSELTYIELGRASFDDALEVQRRLWRQVADSPTPQSLMLLVEHVPPVITLGRTANDRNVLASPQELSRRGIELRHADRGGDVTLHCPGQIVGYPIVHLDLCGRSIGRYLRGLEEVLIRTTRKFGIAARRTDGLTGVWTDTGKIAAIGVCIRRWVSYHGFALNVTTDLSLYNCIVPCGIAGKAVTSMKQETGMEIPLPEVHVALVKDFAAVFGLGAVRRQRV